MEATSEYMETHYYSSKLISGAGAKNHVAYNLFWTDYALFLVDSTKHQFVTANFTRMINEPIQSFFALCIMDLPFQAQAQIHNFESDD